ncbi:cell division protein FtsL [Brevibacillus dissolubilis]|uniref:cell division protein FtsL n=1 Tax=Brevibacillus dissolubilis TaxID=1844116 RepID=UPI00210016C1|nr:cell division protein FtsL [Brevibacillus dissolubilis]
MDLKQQPLPPAQRKRKRVVKTTQGVPTGEKLMYLGLILLLVAMAGFVGLRYLQISQYNYQIQSLNKQITKMQGQNEALQLKIDQMSTRDRIVAEATRQGMLPSENVKVIGSSKDTVKAASTSN